MAIKEFTIQDKKYTFDKNRLSHTKYDEILAEGNILGCVKMETTDGGTQKQTIDLKYLDNSRNKVITEFTKIVFDIDIDKIPFDCKEVIEMKNYVETKLNEYIPTIKSIEKKMGRLTG